MQVVARISKAKLVLSSTDGVADLIRQMLSSYELETKEVEIRLQHSAADINTYIETRVREGRTLAKLRPQMQDHVKYELRSQHNGSFRWVQCTLDDLIRLPTPKAIKEALKGITPSLSDNYQAILAALPDDLQTTAHSMLLYLVSSARQWSLLELAEAAVFTSANEFSEDDRLLEPEVVVRYLRSLVRYEPVSMKVELAHSSVRDFLTSPGHSGKYYIDPLAARRAIAHLCVEYLTNPPFQYCCRDLAALEKRKENWPLFQYASTHWTYHARDILSDDIDPALCRLMTSADLPNGGNWTSWYQCVYPGASGHFDLCRTWPLYVCARHGLIQLLQHILNTCDTWRLEQPGGNYGSTALHVASYAGHSEAVKLLLAAGANPNERNNVGESGMQWAALFEHHDIVQALLEGGADPELLERPFYITI